MRTTIKELKAYCRLYKLKLGGNKAILVERVARFKAHRDLAVKVYKIWRLHVYRVWKQLHNIKEEYTNETDFFSLQNIAEISNSNLFVITEKKYNYAFDMVSFYHLIKKGNMLNPYNREPFEIRTIERFNKLMLYSKFLQIPMELNIDMVVSNEKTLEFRILSVFQTIEELGFYTNPQWVYELSSTKLIKFIKELHDIWNYRAEISTETKRLICPPNGMPFRSNNMLYIQTDNIKGFVISIVEKFIHPDASDEHKYLGACYVLQALTLVSSDAAESLPWLYQSVIPQSLN